MLLSMTGYGNQIVEINLNKKKKINLNIELKSINSRFFEITCRFPNSLIFLENDITSMLKNNILRGRIYLTISTESGDNELQKISPSISVVESYITAAKTLKSKFQLQGNITISDILSLPNVFVTEKIEITKTVIDAILDAIKKAAEKLAKSRRNEGACIQKDLEDRIKSCTSLMEKIKKINEQLMKEQKNLVSKTLSSAQEGNEEAKGQLENAYAILNKMDINEEVIRFQSHLDNAKKIIKNKDAEKGKHLDFVLQELAREINTITAKGSNFDLNTLAVNIKVELEKIREQVQNVL
ncbi:TPA: YicC family protein [Candidatus Dependentiae bacterium]|nr:MAG: hypothetical protein UR14_C0002G0150 [candidate division TM6 bacterium GW2011_GWE2_31_21]KKP53947.1 MAG: hypothetical protein UR43_C0002G0150 [candidate division TM6 bacterium GW2011_GWF2_33_332]HBS47727.1 YicC family protein [Candidatus Dependentiae bacterium]HBZ73876.1 YicC family protein [Candidatus Dependentiae bacterium]